MKLKLLIIGLSTLVFASNSIAAIKLFEDSASFIGETDAAEKTFEFSDNDIPLEGSRYGFGFDLVVRSTGPTPDPTENTSVYRVVLLYNNSEIANFTFAPSHDIPHFIGAWSDKPFDHVKIHKLSSIESEEIFGKFFTSSKIPNEIKVQTGYQKAKLMPSDFSVIYRFATSVAIADKTVVVGAPYNNFGLVNSGAAYIFSQEDSLWSEEIKLIPKDSEAYDEFGRSVDVDNNIVVIGAPSDDDNGRDSGSVYVYTRQEGIWTMQAKLLPDDGSERDGFGTSVAIQGDTILVGAYSDSVHGTFSGSAYVFTQQGSTWTQQAKLIPDDGAAFDHFAMTVALDGDTALIGSLMDDANGQDSGSAYIFIREGENWNQQSKIVPSDGSASGKFGSELALDGDTAIIAAINGDDHGKYNGSAYVFTRQNNIWSQQAKLKAKDSSHVDRFGLSLALKGDTAFIGAWTKGPWTDLNVRYSGSAYIFGRQGTTWTQHAKIFPAIGHDNDEFGNSLDFDGETAIIGALSAKHESLYYPGAAYIFTMETKVHSSMSSILQTAVGISANTEAQTQ